MMIQQGLRVKMGRRKSGTTEISADADRKPLHKSIETNDIYRGDRYIKEMTFLDDKVQNVKSDMDTNEGMQESSSEEEQIATQTIHYQSLIMVFFSLGILCLNLF